MAIKGKPALKLIGHLEPLAGHVVSTGKKQIVKTKGIRTADIVLSTLNQSNVLEPDEYIKQVFFESTAFLPVYYFIKKSGMTRDETIKMLQGVVSRSAIRVKLIERLTSGNTQKLVIPNTSTSAATKKKKYVKLLCNKKVDESIVGEELQYCLQAIRGLTVSEVESNSKYVRDLLRNWFNKHYASAKGPLADNLRRAICWVDEALHMSDRK